MTSTPPPQYNEPTDIFTKFNTCLAYASTHGIYLCQDSQFRIFETIYETSQVLNSILLQFTTPTSFWNVQAIRQLRSLQISNFQQTQFAPKENGNERIMVEELLRA